MCATDAMPEAAPGGTGGAAAAMAQIDAFEARCLAGVQAGAAGLARLP
jgi:hypothetical protein